MEASADFDPADPGCLEWESSTSKCHTTPAYHRFVRCHPNAPMNYEWLLKWAANSLPTYSVFCDGVRTHSHTPRPPPPPPLPEKLTIPTCTF